MTDSISQIASELETIHDRCDTLTINDTNAISEDLRSDIANMWKVKMTPEGGVSSVSSINSAVRAFNTIKKQAVGMGLDSFELLIGKTKRIGYIYEKPFWKTSELVQVYRFDSGRVGYQFNVAYDAAGRIISIDRKWIH